MPKTNLFILIEKNFLIKAYQFKKLYDQNLGSNFRSLPQSVCCVR